MSTEITRLAFAPDGTAWAATPHGVAHWDATSGVGRLYGQPDGLTGSEVTDVAVATDGTVWALGAAWVARFDGTWTSWTEFDGVQPYGTSSLAVAPDGVVWVGADTLDGAKVLRFDGAWTDVDAPPGATASLAVGPNGMLWAQSAEASVYAYDGHAWSLENGYGALPGLPSLVGVGPDGSPWVTLGVTCFDLSGCEDTGRGVARHDDSGWRVFTTADGLLADEVHLVVGRDGSAWATADRSPGKVSRFDGSRWTTIDVAGLAGASPIAAAPDGSLWLASSGGLARFDGRQVTRLAGPVVVERTRLPGLALTTSADDRTESTPLGELTWRSFRVPTGHSLMGLTGTSHGFAVLDGPDLRWSVDGSAWEGTTLPIRASRIVLDGDDLVVLGEGGAVRLAWVGGRWAMVERLDVGGGAGWWTAQAAFGPRGAIVTDGFAVRFSADGHRFEPAVQGPGATERPSGTAACAQDPIALVYATTDGFVALRPAPTCELVLWFSGDGSHWEVRATSPFGKDAHINEIAARGGRYVAGGRGPDMVAMWVSDDGLVWTVLPVLLSSIQRVSAGELGWAILREGGGLWLSRDGGAWEAVPHGLFSLPGSWFPPEVAVGPRMIAASDFDGAMIGTVNP